MNPKNPITETILERAGCSTTEMARRLTLSTGIYYTVNQCAHWIRAERIPPEHARAVATEFGLDIEDVAPYLFAKHHEANNNNNNNNK